MRFEAGFFENESEQTLRNHGNHQCNPKPCNMRIKYLKFVGCGILVWQEWLLFYT
mgnify:CR=1 FL=1